MHTHMKQKCVHTRQNVSTHIYLVCAHVFTLNFMKIVMIVQNYGMTLSFKFHKDMNFCCGDFCKLTLKMYKRCREAFKRKKRKYIGLLQIGGTPPSPNSEDW